MTLKPLALSIAISLLCGCPPGPDDDDDAARTETVCDDAIDDEPDGLVDCGDPDCAEDPACVGDDDDAADDDDTGVGDDDTGVGDDDTGVYDPCADAPVGSGSMNGTITRTADLQEDGIGTVVVAIFPLSPIEDDSVCSSALTTYYDVDLSAADAAFPYELTGIPPLPTDRYIVVLFDDNGDLDDLNRNGPDIGDLIGVDGDALPSVSIPDETPVTLDLVLNATYPAGG